MPIAETQVPIVLDKERTMRFDANSMTAYEEATGLMFMEAVASIFDAIRPTVERARAAKLAKESGQPEAEDAAPELNPFDMVRKVPMGTLTALIWSTVHEYNAEGEPFWPLTLKQVRRHIDLMNIPKLFDAFVRGQVRNSPTKAEMGESQAPSGETTPRGEAPKIEAVPGGERSIELPADALA